MDFNAVWILIKKDHVVQFWCSDVFLVTESDEMKKWQLICDVLKRVNFWIFRSPVTEMVYKPSWCRNENGISTSYRKYEHGKTTKIKPA